MIPAASSTNNNTSSSSAGSSFASRFEYFDEEQPGGGGTQVLTHVAPPKSSNFFNEYGMDSAFTKKSSSGSSKAQVNKVAFLNRKERKDFSLVYLLSSCVG